MPADYGDRMCAGRVRATQARRAQKCALAVFTLLLAALVMATEPASSDDDALTLSLPRLVHAGGKLRAVATVAGVSNCRLHVRGATSIVTLAGPTTVHWTWRVPTRARADRYRVVLSCNAAQRSAVVTVRAAHRRGRKVGQLAHAPIRVTMNAVGPPSPPSSGSTASAIAPPVIPAPRPAPTPSPEPDCDPLLFGVHSPPAPEGGSERIDTLQRELKRRISIVLWYQHWAGWGPEVEPEWIRSAAVGGRRPLLTWEPWRPGSVEQPEFRLGRIAAGDFDDYIRRWALALRDLGPIYLRPMHEMNGDWYPWAGTVNGNSAADYRAAWMHMHDMFERSGAENVRWVWSPYAEDVPATPVNAFEQYYPGDRYVDVLALDGYNWGTTDPLIGGWQTFGQIFEGAYARIARVGSQPIWIAETASSDLGGDKAAWIADMFRTASRLPRLEAIVWFDVDKERDWRLTSSPGVEAAFECADG